MRKLLIVALFSLLASATLSAQQQPSDLGGEFRRHEINLSYGFPTSTMALTTFVKIITLGFAEVDNMSVGALNLDYLCYPIKHIGVGATAGYEYCFEPANADYTARYHYMTLMATAKFYWFNKPYVGMYSRIALGATYGVGATNGERHLRLLPAYQVSGVGLEAGGKVRGFIELGSGSMGVFQGGVRVKF